MAFQKKQAKNISKPLDIRFKPGYDTPNPKPLRERSNRQKGAAKGAVKSVTTACGMAANGLPRAA